MGGFGPGRHPSAAWPGHARLLAGSLDRHTLPGVRPEPQPQLRHPRHVRRQLGVSSVRSLLPCCLRDDCDSKPAPHRHAPAPGRFCRASRPASPWGLLRLDHIVPDLRSRSGVCSCGMSENRRWAGSNSTGRRSKIPVSGCHSRSRPWPPRTSDDFCRQPISHLHRLPTGWRCRPADHAFEGVENFPIMPRDGVMAKPSHDLGSGKLL